MEGYKDIMERGSNELKEIIFIITHGIPPGKQEEEHETESTHIEH